MTDLERGVIVTTITSTLDPDTLEAFHRIEVDAADGTPEALMRATARSAAESLLETVP
jgi:hypothetical protein